MLYNKINMLSYHNYICSHMFWLWKQICSYTLHTMATSEVHDSHLKTKSHQHMGKSPNVCIKCENFTQT